jgi:hypothetical protein
MAQAVEHLLTKCEAELKPQYHPKQANKNLVYVY